MTTIKQRAQKLRLEGKMFSEIQNILRSKIPKSTLSYWCKNINLPKSYYQKIKKRSLKHLETIRKQASVVLRKKESDRINRLIKKNETLIKGINKNVQKIILSMLYLTEGAKYNKTRFLHFTSSSPHIILFFLVLLKICFRTDPSKFRIRIQCRFDQNKEKLVKYWFQLTKIPFAQFYPTYVDKRTRRSNTTKKNYMGVCGVYYFDTQIQLELELLSRVIIENTIGPMA